MNNVLRYLETGNPYFFTESANFACYAIIHAVSNSDLHFKNEAKALIERAKRHEPMDFNLEADYILLKEFMYALSKD